MLFYGTKNEVHLKGTIYTCEDVCKKKYRGVYFQKFCDNYHGTGDFDPFSEKFLTFKSKKSVIITTISMEIYTPVAICCLILVNMEDLFLT